MGFNSGFKGLSTNFNVLNNPSMFLHRFIDVQSLPEYNQDRKKHVGIMTNCVQKMILTSVHLLVLLCEFLLMQEHE